MKKTQKQHLMALGEETLTQALLDLAEQSDSAEAMINRLIATPEEAVALFKKKMVSVKRSKRFIDWREVGHFANELDGLLDDLEASVSDPLTGVNLVGTFYEIDNNVFERCDDSNGEVGSVFARAKTLFVEYGKRCEDKKKVATLLLKLCKTDDYGVRAGLFAYAAECGLPEPIMRSMIVECQQRADKAQDEYKKRHHLMLLESLARQIKDAPLFEAARLSAWGEPLGTAASIDVAQVYFEQGDIDTAVARLSQIPEKETFMADEKDKLWLDIYRQQGDKEKLTVLLAQRFHGYRSVRTLSELLDAIGGDKRETVVSKEITVIFEQTTLNLSDADFLVAIAKIDEAEAYLIEHADELNGNYYDSLLNLAKVMDAEDRFLVTSLIYRSLLVSILERGYSKAYSHGVRYLKKLDKLAVSIADWLHFDNHQVFKEQLYQTHGRKRSFWSKYE